MTLADAFGVVAAAVLSVGGAGGIMLALSKYFGDRVAERWLESVKARYAERLTHVEHQLDQLGKRHQASLDHAVTVSRVQFEEEFRSIREIWKFVARARAAAIALEESQGPADDTPEAQLERFGKRKRTFQNTHRRLVLAIDNNSPFYPEAIYRAVDAFRTVTTKEARRLDRDRPFVGDWFDRRESARNDIIALAEGVSLLIRARLASIVIQEGPGRPLPEVAVVEAERLPQGPE